MTALRPSSRAHRSISGKIATLLLTTVAAALALGAASPLLASSPAFDRLVNQTAINGEDIDNDGLSDLDEIRFYGTNPSLADSDRDGVPDGAELHIQGTNPLNADSDGDGLKDGEELLLGTDPLNADSDEDGLPDGDELAFGIDPLSPDTDGDGLSDGDEIITYGTNALETDTDGDGITDGDEVTRFATDPAQQDAHRIFIHTPGDGSTSQNTDTGMLTRPIHLATEASHPMVARVPMKTAGPAPTLMTLD